MGEIKVKKICKRKFLTNLSGLRYIWFHVTGIACIIWFLVRVIPAPHRARYPCQQMSATVALGYIAFWGALLHGFSAWLKRIRLKTAASLPLMLVVFMVFLTTAGPAFGLSYSNIGSNTESWDPVPKEPIGTPFGLNPGRVVWVWDPDATESELDGYWWESANNDQAVIDQMFSKGIQALAGTSDDYEAWDSLFRFFNQVHGRGDVGYQSGEKIAVKINMNNCWDSYTTRDNDRDASPYVVKALLKQLVNIVGVAQWDITIYDASRPLGHWFYNRVAPEFPDVNYVDAFGDAPGRQKVVASTKRIYFTTGLRRTLPTCVVEADYMINMPILKRHIFINGVTLAGKNMYGTWIEEVWPIHDYHASGHRLGKPAPQTELFAHEHIGGKTLLYIGDGMYATPWDLTRIGKFQMYPFNNDWTNSLFFSQDPVAIDSVMYDFLHAEGTNPSEGSQNYLHQAAEPPPDVYDPENDGVYLSHSLGVHEHWDTSIDIFSPDRYSGPDGNGIDYIPIGEEHFYFNVSIVTPKEKYLYIAGEEIKPLPNLLKTTIIIGNIKIKAEIHGTYNRDKRVEFYIDDELKYIDYEAPYEWLWEEISFGIRTITVIAYDIADHSDTDSIVVYRFF
jgi:hypothetical protein